MLTLTDINRALDRLGVEAFIPRTRRKRPFTPDFGSSCRTCGDPMRRGPATTPFARADTRIVSPQEQAVRQPHEYEGGEGSVLPVALHQGEVEHRGEHARIGRQEQNGEPQIDEQAGTPGSGGELPEVGHDEAEDGRPREVVIQPRARRRPVPRETGSEEAEAREHTHDQDVPHPQVHVAGGGRARAGGLAHLRNPRTIISAARTISTPRKTRRTVSLVRRTRTRVPRNAPAATPRITGAARPGSIRPVAR